MRRDAASDNRIVQLASGSDPVLQLQQLGAPVSRALRADAEGKERGSARLTSDAEEEKGWGREEHVCKAIAEQQL